MTHIKKSFLSGVGWGALDRWGARVLNFLILAILARILNPKSFGLIAAAMFFTDYLDIFVSQGIGYIIIQKKQLSLKDMNAAFWINFVSGVLIGIGLWIAAPYIEYYTRTPELAQVIRSLCPLLIVSGASRIQAAYLTRELKFKYLAIRNFAGNLSGCCTGIIMAYLGYGVWSLVYMKLVSSIVSVTVLWFSSNWRPSLSIGRNSIKEIYRYSYIILIDQQVMFISNRIDEGIVLLYLDPASLGVYSVGKKLLLLVMDSINSILGPVILPLFSRMQDDTNIMFRYLNKCVKYYLFITIPLCGTLAVFSEQIVLTVYGNKWIDSALVSQIIAISGPFMFSAVLIHSVFQATNLPQIPLFLNVFRAVFGATFIILGSRFGIIGISLAFMAKIIVSAIADVVALKAYFKYDIGKLCSVSIKPLAISLISILIARLLYMLAVPKINYIISFAASISIGILIYILAIWKLDQETYSEITCIINDRP